MTTALLLTPEAAAAQLSCGRTYVFGLIASGELESVKIGRLRRIPAVAIAEYVSRLREAQAA